MNRMRAVRHGFTLMAFLFLLVNTEESPSAQGTAPEPSPVRPTATAPPDTTQNQDQLGMEMSLARARLCIKTGEYDQATEILKSAIEQARGHVPRLREAYLLLVQTYVYRGNYYRGQAEGRETSELYYQQARKLIQECLQTKELRHTSPDPPSEYPPEMITLFGLVRSEVFGSLRLIDLNPPDAVVIMDGDTLRSLPSEPALEEVDVPIGPHFVVARANGYRDYTEEISISPNSTLERSISLSKKRGPFWYFSRAGIAAAGVTGVVLATQPEKSTPSPAQPLPDPPDPPH